MRWGGVASRSAMSVIDTQNGMVMQVGRPRGGQPAMATVRVTGTGRVVRGVVWARELPADPSQLTGVSVTLTRIGGRWAVL